MKISTLLPCLMILSQCANAKNLKARPLLSNVDDIKPKSNNEDSSFWMEFGKNDIKNRLQILNSNRIAKNVILFVGDGMGIQTGTMARIFKGQKLGKSGEGEQLTWESFPHTGLSKTYNTDYQVADSAGTATAMLSGVKTRFGVLGIDSTLERKSCEPEKFEKAKIKNMMHWADEAGKNIGLVTNTRVTHATPGASFSHTADRDWENDAADNFAGREGCNEDIAKQLIHGELGKKMKVVFGGGRRNFLPQAQGGSRNEGDLIKEYQDMKEESGNSYRYIETKDDLSKWTSDGMTDYVLGLFSPSHMPYQLDLTPESQEPSLSQMAEAAVAKMLSSNENGFFLLVEGGRIDHAHHENLAQKSMGETVEFDKTIEKVVDMVDLEDTLVIVTADHSHAVTMNGYPTRGNDILGHSFNDPWSSSEYSDGSKLAYSTISYANGPGFNSHFTGNSIVPWKDMRNVDYTDINYMHPAMMPGPDGNYETHGGEDVGIFAVGPMSHLVVGVHEQSYIGHVMAYSACVGPYKEDCDRPSNSGMSLANSVTFLMASVALQFGVKNQLF